MIYLSKFLTKIMQDPALIKSNQKILEFGFSDSQIQLLKKYALENDLIDSSKQGCFLTPKGESFLLNNPIESWVTKEFTLRPNVNLEYLKEEKAPPMLTKAIRNLAKHLIEGQPIKEFSLDSLLLSEIKNCKKVITNLEADIFTNKRISLEGLFEKYLSLGLTKSIISVSLLSVLVDNIDKIAIYEKGQFQLKFNQLMFDRIMACPQNFEIQKTEMLDEYLLKDVSKIILNKKTNNILEITKGLYSIIKSLDKYTMNTQNLSNKTLRLRNVVLNAKDPISLFERDIPKALSGKVLSDCDRQFLNSLKISLNELKTCTETLVKELRSFVFETFNTKSKEDLSARFLTIKGFIPQKELKILMNNIIDIEVSDDLWINWFATFINKYRVPKDWTDEDYADFKVKTKELALKFFVLEATIGLAENTVSENYHSVLNSYLNLSKPEQLALLRKVVNI